MWQVGRARPGLGTARAVSQARHVRLGVGPGLARRQGMPRPRRADTFFLKLFKKNIKLIIKQI